MESTPSVIDGAAVGPLDWLTVDEFAAALSALAGERVAPWTVCRMIRLGTLAARHAGKRAWLIAGSELPLALRWRSVERRGRKPARSG